VKEIPPNNCPKWKKWKSFPKNYSKSARNIFFKSGENCSP
jgi:hypothetical protein